MMSIGFDPSVKQDQGKIIALIFACFSFQTNIIMEFALDSNF